MVSAELRALLDAAVDAIVIIDEQERIMLALAAGTLSREELSAWLAEHARPS